MDQSPDRFAIRNSRIVVAVDGFPGGEDIKPYSFLFKKVPGILGNFQAFPITLGEDDPFGPMLEEVFLLDPRVVTGPALVPIPFTGSSRIELCVLKRSLVSFDEELSPGGFFDAGC